jgi:hypothetical protein
MEQTPRSATGCMLTHGCTLPMLRLDPDERDEAQTQHCRTDMLPLATSQQVNVAMLVVNSVLETRQPEKPLVSHLLQKPACEYHWHDPPGWQV